MIRHIVMWDVRGASRDEKLANIAQLTAAFLGLRGRIPGLLRRSISMLKAFSSRVSPRTFHITMCRIKRTPRG